MSALNILSGKAMVFERERDGSSGRDVLDNLPDKVKVYFYTSLLVYFSLKRRSTGRLFYFIWRQEGNKGKVESSPTLYFLPLTFHFSLFAANE